MLRAAPGAGHQAGTTTTVREVVEMARYDLPECNNMGQGQGVHLESLMKVEKLYRREILFKNASFFS